MSAPQLPPNSGEPVPSPSEEGTVAVVVRVRPSTACEQERDPQPIVQVLDEHMLIFDPEEPGGPPGSVLPPRGPRHQGKDLKFVFDRVFGEGATQEEVFQHTTRDMLDSVLNGYNCSVFAYGATGAGKTHTMLGSEKSPGIMYLTMVELYKRIEARKEEKSCEVLVSYQEVYNEQIHDLLEPKGPLAIREDPEKGVVVRGLSFHQPTSAEQLLEMLANGNKNRTQHPTDANATSSRSHAVFQIYVKQQDRIRGITQELQVSKMSLIDLAGSERASVANTRGERLREGANINRSLLALINVIKALADAKSKKTHVPYRDSKLTRLLKDSIGGNCRTVMIAAVSPSVLAYEDTYNTLKYANRAKEIKLSLKSNVLSFDYHISKYVVICEQLKAEVAELRAKLAELPELRAKLAELRAKLRAYEEAAPRESQNQASQAPSPGGLPSLEEAVPKMGLALDGQQERDREEQELEAGQPIQMQLESEEEVGERVPEEMPPSSLRVTDQADVPLEPKEPTCLPQGLSGSQTETLIAATLSVARKQYALLKDSNLLTPDMVSEFEELERLVRQETGVSLEQAASPSRPTEVGEAAPALGTKLGSDAVVSVAAPSARATRVARPGSRRLASVSSPSPVAATPTKKRRMSSEKRSASQPGAPCSLKTRPKRQRRCAKEAKAPRVAPIVDNPCPEAAAPALPISPVASAFTPKICPPTVTKSRAPLATSATQNHRGLAARSNCAPPAHNLNVTFEICKVGALPEPAAFSTPQQPDWESVQNLLNKQESPFVPKSRVRTFAVKGSSIPKPSVSKASAQKRKRVESTSDPSLAGIQSHVAQLPSSSQKSKLPSRIPEHPALAWKRKKTTTALAALGSATPVPTSQPMKLLC